MNRYTTPHRMHEYSGGHEPQADATESLLIGLRALIDAGCEPEEIVVRIGSIVRIMDGDARHEALREYVTEGNRQKPEIVCWYFDREALKLHAAATMVRVNLTRRRVRLWGEEAPIIVESEDLFVSATQAAEELAHELRMLAKQCKRPPSRPRHV